MIACSKLNKNGSVAFLHKNVVKNLRAEMAILWQTGYVDSQEL